MLNVDSEPRTKLQLDMMLIFMDFSTSWTDWMVFVFLMNRVFKQQRIFLNIVREVMAAVLVRVVTGIALWRCSVRCMRDSTCSCTCWSHCIVAGWLHDWAASITKNYKKNNNKMVMAWWNEYITWDTRKVMLPGRRITVAAWCNFFRRCGSCCGGRHA